MQNGALVVLDSLRTHGALSGSGSFIVGGTLSDLDSLRGFGTL